MFMLCYEPVRCTFQGRASRYHGNNTGVSLITSFSRLDTHFFEKFSDPYVKNVSSSALVPFNDGEQFVSQPIDIALSRYCGE